MHLTLHCPLMVAPRVVDNDDKSHEGCTAIKKTGITSQNTKYNSGNKDRNTLLHGMDNN